MGNRAFKDDLYQQFARLGKALASPARLELLDLLAQGERSVDELAQEASLSVANASAHLQTLHRARLVSSRKEGLRVFYRLADPSIFRLWVALREAGEHQYAEIDRLVATYLQDRRTLQPVSREELAERLRAGDTLVLDVRPLLEYRQGHIAGARSIPIDELAERLAEFEADRRIVAYCRGPYCVFADEAVSILRTHGFSAERYIDGYPDWASAGLPVAHGQSAPDGALVAQQ
jgi:rhodanese-related sulfurtransferase